MSEREQVGAGMSFPGVHVVPSAINPIVGGVTGTVEDIQKWADGNLLQIDEVAAMPGIEFEILFSGVTDIQRIALAINYDGSTSHWIEVALWNYVELANKLLWTINRDGNIDYKYADLPVENPIDRFEFIDGAGNAKMRIYHPVNGNAAHNVFIDYAALIR